jgi:hypothetical protein
VTNTNNVAHHVAAPVIYTNNVAHHVASPVTYAAASPIAYTNSVVSPVARYAGVPVVAKALNHAVAYTANGLTHSSNVGVCTNVHGMQVAC